MPRLQAARQSAQASFEAAALRHAERLQHIEQLRSEVQSGGSSGLESALDMLQADGMSASTAEHMREAHQWRANERARTVYPPHTSTPSISQALPVPPRRRPRWGDAGELASGPSPDIPAGMEPSEDFDRLIAESRWRLESIRPWPINVRLFDILVY